MFAGFPSPIDGKIIFLNESFDLFDTQNRSLQTRPASIYAEYICSVPEARSPLAMIMFTLVGNLALLHSAWALFKYVADRRVSWKDRESNWCEGCLKMHQALEGGERVHRHVTIQGNETRQSIELFRERRESGKTESHREGSVLEEDEGTEALVSIGGLLRSETSSTQTLIPG